MKTHIPDNCGNSPRSLMAIDVAINFAANRYDKLEPLLADGFSWSIAGSDDVVTKPELEEYMDKATQSEAMIEKFEILTSISHGKYAAVGSRAHLSDGSIADSHDLYEFTGAGSSAKLRKITAYVVDSKCR